MYILFLLWFQYFLLFLRSHFAINILIHISLFSCVFWHYKYSIYIYYVWIIIVCLVMLLLPHSFIDQVIDLSRFASHIIYLSLSFALLRLYSIMDINIILIFFSVLVWFAGSPHLCHASAMVQTSMHWRFSILNFYYKLIFIFRSLHNRNIL